MANKSRNKVNQPPTGEGKRQSPRAGKSGKLDKRSEVAQAQRNRPGENIGTSFDEDASSSELSGAGADRKLGKAGR
jgi:hypothetical protein